MPATACFISRPFLKMREGMEGLRAALSLVADFPHVRRERVEGAELARARALERDLQIRQERIVRRDLRGRAAARGNRQQTRVPCGVARQDLLSGSDVR